MANSEELVRWANNAKLDEVSTPIELNDKMVVAILTDIKEKGVPSYDNIEERFRKLVIQEKKVELAIAAMEGNTDLDNLAASLNVQVQNASNIPMSSNAIPGGGSNEPEVIGSIFTLEVGDISVPLKGKEGVYVVEVLNKVVVPLEDIDPELFAEDANGNYANRVNTGVFSALRIDAEVEDNRSSFY